VYENNDHQENWIKWELDLHISKSNRKVMLINLFTKIRK